MSTDFDAIVVGAGSVGLACGYALARQGQSVAVLERERRVGAGISSRNSEVIHAGLHYPPGSLKARFCVEGRRLMYEFLDRHNVAYNKCGKLIVATQDSELAALDALAARGEANGVEGVTRLDAAQALALEPALRTVGALHSAESGVFDAHGFMDALVGEIEAHGGAVVLNSPFPGGDAVGRPGGGAHRWGRPEHGHHPPPDPVGRPAGAGDGRNGGRGSLPNASPPCITARAATLR
jgi:L-2-hydroxyglutarate oxidase LhgO